MHLDHYLTTRINVLDIARKSVEAGVSLLRCRPENVLTMFIGTKYVQLKVLHDNVKACGFVGVEHTDYSYLDHTGHPVSIFDAVQAYVYVAPADTYDHIYYTTKLLLQETQDANVIEMPTEPGTKGSALITYWDVINVLRVKLKFAHAGTNPHTGNQVYVRTKS